MFDKDLKPWLQKLDGLDFIRDNMYQEVYLYEKALLQQREEMAERMKCQSARKARIELHTAQEILEHRTRQPAQLRIAIEDIVEFEQAQREIEERLHSRQLELEQLKQQQHKQNKWKPATLHSEQPKMDWRTTRKLRELQTKRNKLLNHMEQERRRVNPRAHPKRLH